MTVPDDSEQTGHDDAILSRALAHLVEHGGAGSAPVAMAPSRTMRPATSLWRKATRS